MLKKLVYRQAYEEGLPVVEDPEVINPEVFLKQVLEERLVNPKVPDNPQRIVTDTSQKVGVSYGGTIRAYGQNAKNLCYVPLAIAGWCRYLMGVDDEGKPFELSSDPLLEELKKNVSKIKLGKPQTLDDELKPILSNEEIFGIDLYSVGIAQKVEQYTEKMISGVGDM